MASWPPTSAPRPVAAKTTSRQRESASGRNMSPRVRSR